MLSVNNNKAGEGNKGNSYQYSVTTSIGKDFVRID